jgi:hypothetical protein
MQKKYTYILGDKNLKAFVTTAKPSEAESFYMEIGIAIIIGRQICFGV